MKNKKILGVFRARKGSKRLLDKNLRILGGRPIIEYTIEAALNSKYMTDLVLITNDERVVEITNKHKIRLIDEPEELTRDYVPQLKVVTHALNQFSKENGDPDIIVPFQFTSPFRTAKHVDESIDLLVETGADSVVGVKEITERPEWMYKLKENGKMEKLLETDLLGSYGAPKLFILNGAIYAAKTSSFRKFPTYLFGEDIRAYIMDPISSIDIDTELDLKFAETVLKEGMVFKRD